LNLEILEFEILDLRAAKIFQSLHQLVSLRFAIRSKPAQFRSAGFGLFSCACIMLARTTAKSPLPKEILEISDLKFQI
jgi:hypothetical protein